MGVWREASGEKGSVMTDPPADTPMRCTVAGGSLVGLSTAIALSRLGFAVTVDERSPARAVDGGGGLGVDVALLREVTGIGEDPPVQRGIDRDTTAWHLLESWLEEHALRRAGVTVRRGIDVISATPGDEQSRATVVTDDGTDDADLVIGADGARSTVRATVDPSALVRYQRQRLGPAIAHVSRSERATVAYLAQAGGLTG